MAENPESSGMALGRHMTVEFYDCSPRILADAVTLEKIFCAAARRAGATVVGSNFHRFDPQGVSGVVIISESHFAVHAWPEHDYAAVDLFTCGGAIDFDIALQELAAGLASGQWIVSSMMNRGIVGTNGVERLVPVVENGDCRFSLSWENRFTETSARAISAAIDIYECRVETLDCCGAQERFAQSVVEHLHLKSSGAWQKRDCGRGWCAWSLSLEGGHLLGKADLKNRNAYIDLFAAEYFEPRAAAEFAMRELAGSYYRLQPHIRQ